MTSTARWRTLFVVTMRRYGKSRLNAADVSFDGEKGVATVARSVSMRRSPFASSIQQSRDETPRPVLTSDA
jgi:hypothetical protein